MGYSTLLNSSALQNTIISIYQLKKYKFYFRSKMQDGYSHIKFLTFIMSVLMRNKKYIFISTILFFH